MTTIVLALALAGQYPSPQQQQVTSLPAQLVYSVPAPTYAAPNVVTLGAGQVIPPGVFGQFLGHVGTKLQKHAWPRVQPIAAAPAPLVQTVYVSVQQPQPVAQAVYAVPQPLPQLPVGVPAPPAKVPPPAYGAPQQPAAPQYNAPRPSESVPPVPNR